MKNTARLLTGAALALSLAACMPGMQTPPPSAQEISSAQSAGSLDRLYADVSKKLAKAPSDSGLMAAKRQIGGLLAAAAYDRMVAALDDFRTADGVVPAATLQQLTPELEPLQQWSTEHHDRAQQLLQGEERKLKVKEEALLAELDATPPAEMSKSIGLIDQLTSLTGETAKYEKLNTQRIAAAVQYADQRFAIGEYRQAQEVYAAVLDIAPEQAGIAEKSAEADMLDTLQRIGNLKADGKIDQAFELAIGLVGHARVKQHDTELNDLLAEFAEYYNLVAQSSLTEDNVLQAYRNIARSNLAASNLPDFYLDQSPTQDFVSQLLLLTNDAKQQNHLGAAMGYLLAVKEVAPTFQGLEPLLQDVKDRIYEASVVKVATSTFKSPPDAQGLGNILTAKIMHLLSNKNQQDIRLLERGSLDDILKEQEIMAMNQEMELTISSADFLVQGALLEATVDTSKQPSQQTKRVVVDRNMVPNPEHATWLVLDEELRKKQPEPEKLIEQEIFETVSYTITEHRKVGSMTSAFRVINPSTSKLLHTETLVTDRSYEDFSSEGVEIGLFVQEVKLARLPADSRILRDLADEQAEEIASKLFERFKNPEQAYLADSETLANDGLYENAVEKLAMAAVLKEHKALRYDDLLPRLKQYALQSR